MESRNGQMALLTLIMKELYISHFVTAHRLIIMNLLTVRTTRVAGETTKTLLM